jgi:hypothetical protein
MGTLELFFKRVLPITYSATLRVHPPYDRQTVQNQIGNELIEETPFVKQPAEPARPDHHHILPCEAIGLDSLYNLADSSSRTIKQS